MSAERILRTNIFSGVWDLFTKDLDKPVEDRYTHQITTTPSGGSLIFTANSYLLNLVHTATGLHVDTTFKRAAGDHKEVEFAIWVPAVQRGRFSTVLSLFTNLALQQLPLLGCTQIVLIGHSIKPYSTLFKVSRNVSLASASC
jgi:hypothetical protein